MNKGQVLLTFDDGTADHYAAAAQLVERGLRGAFGIVTSNVGSIGFLYPEMLQELRDKGHFICNHSAKHLWSGDGAPKVGLKSYPKDEITKDYLEAKEYLMEQGFHGDYLFTPFGTSNVVGDEHLEELLKEFRWIRMTIGAPLPEDMGRWTPTGAKRLYPHSYSGNVIGISAAADTRHPTMVREAIDNACAVGSLAVIVYHSVTHVVGDTMYITWERFISDIDYMAKKVKAGELEYVLPDMLIDDKEQE